MAAPLIETQVMDALRGTAALIYRFRIAAIGILMLLAGLLALAGDVGWRQWVLGATAAIVVGFALADRRAPTTREALAARIGSIFVLHTAVISTTGGVESPLLPIYVPVAVLYAVAVGRRRLLVLAAAGITSAVAVMWALRMAGVPIEVPALMRWGAPRPVDTLHLAITSGVICAIVFIGGAIGLHLRRNLDDAMGRVAEARAETLATLQAQHHELAELSEALAHELKNPLAAIRSLSDLVARRLDGASREAAHMQVLTGEVRRLGDTLDEFLNLSRPAGGLAVTRVALRAVARLYEGTAAPRVSVAEAAGGPDVRCDPRKLRQILINLVENARQAIGSSRRQSAAAESIAIPSGCEVAQQHGGASPSPLA